MARTSSSETGTRKQPSRLRLFLIRAVLVVGICGGLAFFIVTRVIFASFSVPTSAMENTIMVGDHILVDRSDDEPARGKIIVFDFPGYRDQVEPDEPHYYMKRCVAMPGDTLEVREKVIHINGVAQAEPPGTILSTSQVDPGDRLRTFPEGAGYTRDNWGPMRIPKKGDVVPLNDSTFYAWRTFILREGHTIEQYGDGVVVDGKTVTQYVVERDYCFGMGDNRDNSLDSRYWGFIPVENIAGTPWRIYWSEMPEPSEDEDGVRWDRISKTVE